MKDVVDRISDWLEDEDPGYADKTLRDARAEIIALRAKLDQRRGDSLRDTFAAAALTALAGGHAAYHKEPPGLAAMAYAMADAMLAERVRQKCDTAQQLSKSDSSRVVGGDTSQERVAPQAYSQHDEKRGDSDTFGVCIKNDARREQTDLDAAPAARATDTMRADTTPGEYARTLEVDGGTGDTFPPVAAGKKLAATRLTDSEREAIHWAIGDVADITGPVEDALRGLLERLK